MALIDVCSYQPTRDEMSYSHIKELDEDGDEALSFCDMPIYSDTSADWGVGYTSSSEEANLFEFASSGFPAVGSTYQRPENIVFCGRMIPSGGGSSSPSKKKQKTSNNNNPGGGRSRGGSKSLMSTSVKGIKWYKVMFGFTRLTGEMEMADIKSRQRQGQHHRKHPKNMIKMHYEDEEHGMNKLAKRSGSGNGLIGLVRSLSCRGFCSTQVF